MVLLRGAHFDIVHNNSVDELVVTNKWLTSYFISQVKGNQLFKGFFSLVVLFGWIDTLVVKSLAELSIYIPSLFQIGKVVSGKKMKILMANTEGWQMIYCWGDDRGSLSQEGLQAKGLFIIKCAFSSSCPKWLLIKNVYKSPSHSFT